MFSVSAKDNLDMVDRQTDKGCLLSQDLVEKDRTALLTTSSNHYQESRSCSNSMEKAASNLRKFDKVFWMIELFSKGHGFINQKMAGPSSRPK